MRTLLIATALIIAAGWMGPSRAWTSGSELDVSNVRQVTITGPASLVRLTTSRDGPYRAELRGRPEGWFASWRSGWTGGGCADAGSIRLDGSELKVNTGAGAWFGVSDCRLELSATLPEDIAVSIEQEAISSRFQGRFAALRIHSRAGDITLDGQAREVAIEGNAIRARLVYGSVGKDDSIALDGNAIDADLSFAGATAVNYAVTGRAALVDSALPNRPDAKPAIAVRGDFLRLRIRGE
ncbi:hypothetical protein [Labrys neptuniae]